MRERAVLAGAVVLFFVVGYFGVGWLATDSADALSLATPLDAAIPFVLGSVVVYWSILPMGLLPVFVVADRDALRRVALAYAVTIAVALAIFIALPVTSQGFRPDARTYADAGFRGWLLQLLYFVDPPLNLFPSLHLALACLAALAALHVRSPIGPTAVVWTLFIAVSVCTSKQHYALDAVAGVGLAALVHRVFVASRVVPAAAEATFGSRGIALFGALVVLFYAGLYGAYLVGVEPWTWAIG